MMESRSPDDLPAALGRLRASLNTAYERASGQLGLSAQQAELLCAAMAPKPTGQLARALHCDRSNVTRMVDRASARGLMGRRSDEVDGRVTTITLTPSGRRLAQRLIAILEGQTADLRRAWPEARTRIAVDILTEISSALEKAIHST